MKSISDTIHSPGCTTLTRQWRICLVLAFIPPLENSKRRANREALGRVLQRDNAISVRDKLVDFWVLLELELGAEVNGGGCENNLELREVRV